MTAGPECNRETRKATPNGHLVKTTGRTRKRPGGRQIEQNIAFEWSIADGVAQLANTSGEIVTPTSTDELLERMIELLLYTEENLR